MKPEVRGAIESRAALWRKDMAFPKLIAYTGFDEYFSCVVDRENLLVALHEAEAERDSLLVALAAEVPA